MVTTMLAKTSAYVRRTSVARSTPLRTGNVLTAGLYEKPMASSDSVGEFDENIYPGASRKSRRVLSSATVALSVGAVQEDGVAGAQSPHRLFASAGKRC